MSLTFDDYQQQAVRTAIYPEKRTGSPMALAYVALGLGEAGEVQGKIKKILRDHDGEITPDARGAIAKELGDLLWYVAVTAEELGVWLGAVAQGNLDKLADRAERGVLQGSGDNR